jgi:hypothetical protein
MITRKDMKKLAGAGCPQEGGLIIIHKNKLPRAAGRNHYQVGLDQAVSVLSFCIITSGK